MYIVTVSTNMTAYTGSTRVGVRICKDLVDLNVIACFVAVRERRNLPNYSPCVKKTCVRQVVLDK